MSQYKTIFLTLITLLPLSIFAQKIAFSGYVHDASTGEVLIGVTVIAPDYKLGSSTNTYGYFSVSIPAEKDSVTLFFSYLGFQSLAVRMRIAAKNDPLNINLVSDGNTLEEVVIKAHADNENVQRTAMSVVNLPISQIKAIPVIAGERDVLKAVQFLPGVSAGSEGTTGFFCARRQY